MHELILAESANLSNGLAVQLCCTAVHTVAQLYIFLSFARDRGFTYIINNMVQSDRKRLEIDSHQDPMIAL